MRVRMQATPHKSVQSLCTCLFSAVSVHLHTLSLSRVSLVFFALRRLFYLSRSDGERLVLPVLQILNTLPRVLQHPPALSPAATKTGREDRPFVSPRSPLSVAPPFAAICGVCLLTLSKDKSFCSELFKKVRSLLLLLTCGVSRVFVRCVSRCTYTCGMEGSRRTRFVMRRVDVPALMEDKTLSN